MGGHLLALPCLVLDVSDQLTRLGENRIGRRAGDAEVGTALPSELDLDSALNSVSP